MSLVLFALAAFIGYFFLSGFIWGAGYYPTDRKEIDTVGMLLDLREGTNFYDLGSGYGRMVVAVAQRFGAHCVGIEVDPTKCWWTKWTIKRKHLEGKVEIVQSNFLHIDLSKADAVFIFLSSEGKIMSRLFEKLHRECHPGTKIVSYDHKFKNWSPIKKEGKLSLYLVEGLKADFKGSPQERTT